MKLAKKMLASVIALAMVAALALTAFAAAPVLNMTASEAYVGETVTVTLSATGMAGLESADLEFTYDATVLEFVSVAKAEGAGYDMGVGDKIADGTATWSLIYTNAADADTDLVVLTFNVLKEGDATVSVAVNSWDGTDAAAEGTSTTVKATVKVVETTTEEESVEETTVEETTVEATTKAPEIVKTGDAGVAAVAGVMALAAVAFVVTRKKDAE